MKKTYVLIFIFLTGLILFSINIKRNKRNLILTDNIQITGSIYKISDASKFRTEVCYEYYYKAAHYYKCELYVLSNSLVKSLLKKELPILISKVDNSKSKLLLFREDFQSYKIKYPDSLSWIDRER